MLRLFYGILSSLLLVGCAPKYPKCDSDEHCRKGEHCINGKCQQCRDDKDCGPGKICHSGRCDPGCRTSDDCPGGQVCKAEQCGPCATDADCGVGGRCQQGKCLPPKRCTTDKDCPPNQECQNGICVGPPIGASAPARCTPQTIYFDFNESVLTVEATNKLQENRNCIQSVPRRKLRLEGHCDPRGTDAYNMALGDRRARSVRRYLERLGADASRLRPLSKGKLEATGTDETSWAMDRKVTFAWE
jgi:peptidoglycan-associated lipoprotein